MNKQKIKGILSAVAPTLAAAIGGPLAGVAAQAITGGLSDTSVPDLNRVEQLLTGASGGDMVKLKRIEAEFAAQMEEAGVEIARIEADDRASARHRQAQMKDKTPAILGGFIILGFFGVLAYIFRFGLPAAGTEVLLIMVGSLGVMVTQVANYYFGSSVGSKSKDVTIAALKGQAR